MNTTFSGQMSMCPMKVDGPADSGDIPSGGHSRDGRNSERLDRIVVGP